MSTGRSDDKGKGGAGNVGGFGLRGKVLCEAGGLLQHKRQQRHRLGRRERVVWCSAGTFAENADDGVEGDDIYDHVGVPPPIRAELLQDQSYVASSAAHRGYDETVGVDDGVWRNVTRSSAVGYTSSSPFLISHLPRMLACTCVCADAAAPRCRPTLLLFFGR